MRTLVCFAVVVTSAGCVDITSSTGQEGRLLYSLSTDYDVPQGELTDARIVTRHEQYITVQLTALGRQELESPHLIQHRVVPAEGVTITGGTAYEGAPPDFRIEVSEPGVYTVESTEAGELVDRIALTFAALGGFELATMVRAPWGESFDRATGDPIVVQEGSQVTFQPIPVDEAGQRLAGDLSTTIAVEPEWAVVPGQGVISAWEGGVWSVKGEINFYFIEPTLVTFIVTDPVSGATGEQVFDVTPVVME
jgi:hypothetical protein